jgi:hypothetical protein
MTNIIQTVINTLGHSVLDDVSEDMYVPLSDTLGYAIKIIVPGDPRISPNCVYKQLDYSAIHHRHHNRNWDIFPLMLRKAGYKNSVPRQRKEIFVCPVASVSARV